jgi:hypothetical protein
MNEDDNIELSFRYQCPENWELINIDNSNRGPHLFIDGIDRGALPDLREEDFNPQEWTFIINIITKIVRAYQSKVN